MLSDHPPALAQLDDELVGWLTTVNGEGQPQSSPVWHVIDEGDVLVYSRPDAVRLTNISRNPRVSYNLRGDVTGDTIVTLEGTARVDASAPTPIDMPVYVAKYREEMKRNGWTVERYDQEFPVAVRITVTRVRAYAP